MPLTQTDAPIVPLLLLGALDSNRRRRLRKRLVNSDWLDNPFQWCLAQVAEGEVVMLAGEPHRLRFDEGLTRAGEPGEVGQRG